VEGGHWDGSLRIGVAELAEESQEILLFLDTMSSSKVLCAWIRNLKLNILSVSEFKKVWHT
jgi:hypothetical protein